MGIEALHAIKKCFSSVLSQLLGKKMIVSYSLFWAMMFLHEQRGWKNSIPPNIYNLTFSVQQGPAALTAGLYLEEKRASSETAFKHVMWRPKGIKRRPRLSNSIRVYLLCLEMLVITLTKYLKVHRQLSDIRLSDGHIIHDLQTEAYFLLMRGINNTIYNHNQRFLCLLYKWLII